MQINRSYEQAIKKPKIGIFAKIGILSHKLVDSTIHTQHITVAYIVYMHRLFVNSF